MGNAERVEVARTWLVQIGVTMEHHVEALAALLGERENDARAAAVDEAAEAAAMVFDGRTSAEHRRAVDRAIRAIAATSTDRVVVRREDLGHALRRCACEQMMQMHRRPGDAYERPVFVWPEEHAAALERLGGIDPAHTHEPTEPSSETHKEAMTDTEPVILPSDPRAAEPVTVTAWRSRRGHLTLEEHLARRDGATHFRCDAIGCDQLISTHDHGLLCPAHQALRVLHEYATLPRETWDGASALYSGKLECYFLDTESLRRRLGGNVNLHLQAVQGLRLQLCEPQFAHELDPEEIYDEIVDPDGSPPDWMTAAFDALNEKIRQAGESEPPVSWLVSDVAADPESVLQVLQRTATAS